MNIELPKELIDNAKEKKLIIFIGAGLSTNCGLPNWNDLVIEILNEKKEYIKKADILKDSIEVFGALEVLEKIKEHKKHIYDVFDKKLSVKINDSNLHKLLGKISRKFITTNFDSIIEFSLNINTVILKDSNYKLQQLDTAEEYVLKIHGDIGSPDNCVIFKEQYENLYHENENLGIFQLKKLLSQHTFLFLGFSFNDPYVEELFGYVSSLMDGYGPKHYMISTNHKVINHINNINIVDYKNLEKVLSQLVFEKSIVKDTIKKDAGTHNKIEEFRKIIDGTDIAPNVIDWVGRENELKVLKSDTFKVYLLTGMGGEGKSSLASYYMERDEYYSIHDWRDFKEEKHKFQHKILSMIKKINSKIDDSKLVGLEEEELIEIFFEELGDKNGIFVLDNVDSYIDLEEFELFGSIRKLFDAALKHKHKSKFIFTCRPFVRDATTGLHQIRVKGLTVEDTIEYFLMGKFNMKNDIIEKYAKEAFSMTNGHALWLSIIKAQATKGEAALKIFINNIKNNVVIDDTDTSILASNVLNYVWKNLHEREKLVLRALAESLGSESEEDFAEILRTEINYKNFKKAIKSLRKLNLIIQKRGTVYIELHPLVKEFIRYNYISEERNVYISLLINYYDKMVVILKPRLNDKLTYDELKSFTNKIELSINAKKYNDAIGHLLEIMTAMTNAGYIEEYLRVSKLLFDSITWKRKTILEYPQFDILFIFITGVSFEYGDSEYSNELIEKYENLFEKKEQQYFKVLQAKTYNLWLSGKNDIAIDMCEQGLYLLKRASQPDNYDLKHRLALCLRDTKEDENIRKALDIFLLTNKLDELLGNTINSDISGTTYGNVGKCLYLIKEYNNSIICYSKSFYLIFEKSQLQKFLNLGYATYWIAEVLYSQGDNEKAYYFYKYSQINWEKGSPYLMNKNRRLNNDELRSTTFDSINSLEEWKIERYCLDYIEKRLNIKFS